MTEPRRVRTQVERDADGVAWRQTADTRPGYATWPHTAPGNPSWWRRSLPCGADPAPETEGIGEVTVTLDNSAGRFLPQPCRGCHACATDSVDLPAEPDTPGEQPHWDAEVAAFKLGMVLREHLPAIGEELTELLAQPRRRWWHRLTRRAL